MTTLRRTGGYLVRGRYLLLIACAVGLTLPGFFLASHRYWSDWIIFEIGARTLTHWHHLPPYSGASPLHLYDNDPVIQIGPPPLLLLAATQYGLAPNTVTGAWVVVMALLGVGAVRAVEVTALRIAGARGDRIRATALIGGLPLVAAWGYECAHYHHLDDALALLAAATAMWLIAAKRSSLLVGVLLGLAAASKPWAIAFAPLVLCLPRTGKSKACLGFVSTAAAFWGPFIMAAPTTIHSLGGFRIIPMAGSIPYLLGIHGHVEGWLRPTQFVVSIGLAGFVAARRHWAAVPLAGVAGRVLFDPYVYAYYGLGPVLFALAWDLIRPGERKLPFWTAWTLLVEFGLRLVAPAGVCAVGRLAWVLSVVGGVVIARHQVVATEEPSVGSVPQLAALTTG